MLSRTTPEPPRVETREEVLTPSGRLATFYGEPLALVLQLQAAAEFGDADVLRERTQRMLRQSEREAQDAGVSRDDTREASFGVVAFLDETVQRSAWSERDEWVRSPLQQELFDRNDAGEEFFNRLERLRSAMPERADVLEVYYLCLALGFRGKLEFASPNQHRDLISDVYADLARVPLLAPGPLAPHAEPVGRVAATVRRQVPAWAVLAACAALCVIAYASLAVYARSNAGSAISFLEQERAETIQNGPAAAEFGAAPTDPLAEDSTATPEASGGAAPAPVDGFPRSDALPEEPVEPVEEAPDDDLPADDAPEASGDAPETL